jgi:hypothetical protein
MPTGQIHCTTYNFSRGIRSSLAPAAAGRSGRTAIGVLVVLAQVLVETKIGGGECFGILLGVTIPIQLHGR